ncbi:hypothetical protein NB037_03180 [Rathayibacter sp. ZW T2_19]|uniref:Uncharacterized protein n=1 Tax=Rathayibacter rubneri TaxID=2950106 RepID=A0A9X2IRE8_9MICO|nr:hypothetical protein [Rathayibacter rubneri]MCM6761411.1 hypothetical protein [Rathayibacter rubneri]
MSRALIIAREQRDRAEAARADAELQLASVTRDRDLLIAASFRLVGAASSEVTHG